MKICIEVCVRLLTLGVVCTVKPSVLKVSSVKKDDFVLLDSKDTVKSQTLSAIHKLSCSDGRGNVDLTCTAG